MKQRDILKQTGLFLRKNSVVLVFAVLLVVSYLVSGVQMSFLLQEIVSRFSRNGFLVLSLIIPIVAGLGINFGIVIGAMAGQMAIIHVVSLGFTGFGAFCLSLLVSIPLAVLFGLGTGKILNKTKGNEMITTMILGYFASGIYQFLYLFLMGKFIPFPDESMIVVGGQGLLSTLNLQDTFKYSLDSLLSTTLQKFLLVVCILMICWSLFQLVRRFRKGQRDGCLKWVLYIFASLGVAVYSQLNEMAAFTLNFVDVPVASLIMIALLCLFNTWILKTKLGQNIRTVGQNQLVAVSSGINVDRTRIIAIILSTVFAAWGQIISLQNIGTINVYSSHEQVGTFAAGAILVGGASIFRATNFQALMGVVLFHALIAVSPMAGIALFDDEQIGEFFRVFIAYGVIFVPLALNAAKNSKVMRAK